MIPELQEFHQFIGDKLKAGASSLSPEEVLDEWRELHPDEQFTEDDYAAITEALDDVDNGDNGIPIDEFLRGFERQHKL